MRVLSIDGGGYLGLASASLLHALEERYEARCHTRFDLFCGTSTGAIIALALAAGKSASDVVRLYETLGPVVFKRPGSLERMCPALRRMRSLFVPLHNNRALRAVLEKAFGDQTLADLAANGRNVLVTAFNVTSGRPVVFKTDHAPSLSAHGKYRLSDIALASCAAPMFLPLVELQDPSTGVVERYCDGGVVANSPALLGYVEALTFLQCSPSDLSVLSVGTPRQDLTEAPSVLGVWQRSVRRGLLGWGLGERIMTVAVDAGGMVADSALRFLARTSRTKYVRIPLAQPMGLGLDIATPDATTTLLQLGVAKARDAEVLQDVRSFFADKEESDV